MSGGGQERGLRSGTVPTPLVVGLGAACAVAGRELQADLAHVRRLEERLRTGITSQLQVRGQGSGCVEQALAWWGGGVVGGVPGGVSEALASRFDQISSPPCPSP